MMSAQLLLVIGLIAAMGIPSMLQMLRKDGMRLAVDNVMTLLTDARAAVLRALKQLRIDQPEPLNAAPGRPANYKGGISHANQ